MPRIDKTEDIRNLSDKRKQKGPWILAHHGVRINKS